MKYEFKNGSTIETVEGCDNTRSPRGEKQLEKYKLAQRERLNTFFSRKLPRLIC